MPGVRRSCRPGTTAPSSSASELNRKARLLFGVSGAWSPPRATHSASASYSARRTVRPVQPRLSGPGSARCSRSTRPCCCGRRNCEVNLNTCAGIRSDLNCEPQQARGIPRNLQVDETLVLVFGGVGWICCWWHSSAGSAARRLAGAPHADLPARASTGEPFRRARIAGRRRRPGRGRRWPRSDPRCDLCHSWLPYV